MPKGRPKTKTAIVQLRVPPQLKAAAELAAERDHRSLTGFIEVLILNHCQTHDIPIIAASHETSHEE
jgi:hypothetical protein